MKRSVLYSSAGAGRTTVGAVASTAAAATGVVPATSAPAVAVAAAAAPAWRRRLARHERTLVFGAGLLVALALLLGRDGLRPPARNLTQEAIDNAVLHTLQTRTLPSRAAAAAEKVLPSVVRVRSWAVDIDNPGGNDVERGVGSGVVVSESGVILTNLHVIAGAERLTVTFADGMEAEATVVRGFPDKDLAVIRARSLPDDLQAATLGASGDLLLGDDVVAVGFPFGIGPSVSAGVVSGLNREFRSPEGRAPLAGLIQFDAAANPGNSGGPLIAMNGDVVGIVTAILNPTPARTFIGIGFATTIEDAGGAMGIPPF